MNTHYDTTRGETPFYLVHGWDAKLPIEAMIQIRRDSHAFSKAARWRIEVQRHYMYAREVVYRRLIKAKRRRR